MKKEMGYENNLVAHENLRYEPRLQINDDDRGWKKIGKKLRKIEEEIEEENRGGKKGINNDIYDIWSSCCTKFYFFSCAIKQRLIIAKNGRFRLRKKRLKSKDLEM